MRPWRFAWMKIAAVSMNRNNRINTHSLSTLLFAMLIGSSFACNDPLVRLGSDLFETTDPDDPTPSASDTGDLMDTDSEPFGTEPDSDFIDDLPNGTDRGWQWSEWSEQCRSCAVDYCHCVENEDVVLNDDTDNTIPFNDTNVQIGQGVCGLSYNDCALSNCTYDGSPDERYPKLGDVDCNNEIFRTADTEGTTGSSSFVLRNPRR